MSHVELTTDPETQGFIQNKSLLLAQLKHQGIEVANFYPKGQRMSEKEMVEALGLTPGKDTQFTVRDGRNTVDVTGLAKLMEALSGSDEGAVVQNYNPNTVKTSVVPGARGYTMLDGLDAKHKGGVFAYDGRPEYRDKTVALAHDVTEKCGLHIATIYTIIEKGKPRVVNVEEWSEEIPEFAIPYVVATVKAMGETGVQAVGESVIELAAATVIEIE